MREQVWRRRGRRGYSSGGPSGIPWHQIADCASTSLGEQDHCYLVQSVHLVTGTADSGGHSTAFDLEEIVIDPPKEILNYLRACFGLGKRKMKCGTVQYFCIEGHLGRDRDLFGDSCRPVCCHFCYHWDLLSHSHQKQDLAWMMNCKLAAGTGSLPRCWGWPIRFLRDSGSWTSCYFGEPELPNQKNTDRTDHSSLRDSHCTMAARLVNSGDCWTCRIRQLMTTEIYFLEKRHHTTAVLHRHKLSQFCFQRNLRDRAELIFGASCNPHTLASHTIV